MNTGDLKEQMKARAEDWETMFTSPDGKGRPVPVGRTVRDWLRVIDSMTSKLVNPRKAEEKDLEMQLASANRSIEHWRKQFEQLKKQRDEATKVDDPIADFHERADDGDFKRS